VDDALKKQLVTLAAYSLITGVIILACITISFGIRGFFTHRGPAKNYRRIIRKG
jgi:hypothetical protein